MLDRNKTQLTHDVTNATSAWMDEKGFKPVETEVTVAPGWCADLAGVLEPTETELIGLKFLKRQPSWDDKRRGAGWTKERYLEQQSIKRRLSRIMTCLVEVKTSRSDFCGDRKWTLAVPTDLAYVVFPKGMVRQDEWPAGWGILEYSTVGIRCVRTPTPQFMPADQQRDVIMSIAVRRDHHTRYARWREIQKLRRAEEAAARPIERVSDVVRALFDVIRGYRPTLEETLRYHRLADNLPRHVMERLRELYALKPDLGEDPDAIALRKKRRQEMEARVLSRFDEGKLESVHKTV